MLQSTRGSLVIVGLNTALPEFFWKGQKLNHVIGMRGHFDTDDNHLKLRIDDQVGAQEALYTEMTAAGVSIKRVGG